MKASSRNICVKILQRIRKAGVLPILEESIPKYSLRINVFHTVCNQSIKVHNFETYTLKNEFWLKEIN